MLSIFKAYYEEARETFMPKLYDYTLRGLTMDDPTSQYHIPTMVFWKDLANFEYEMISV